MTVGLLSFASLLSGFNLGRSQGQSTQPDFSGDFPFLNLFKMGAGWWGNISTNSNSTIDPTWLDANGYPLASVMDGTNGVVFQNITFPNSASKISNASNPMVITWEGNATINIGNAPFTVVSGSTSSILNGYGFNDGLYHGRYVWYPTVYNNNNVPGTYSINAGVGTIAPGSYIRNFQLFFASDEAALLAGQIFAPQFKSVLQQANFGVYRFMDWLQTNSGNVTTWATRKSLNYSTWTEDEYRSSLYAGVTTNIANDYSLTPLGSYVWQNPVQGNYTAGGAPVDKQTMHMRFNSNATLVQNSDNGGSLILTSLSPVTFRWPSNPLVNGDIVSISGGTIGGDQILGTNQAVNYFVVNVAAAGTDTFQVALTAGGTPIASSSAENTNFVTRMPTLNLNGTGKFPIRLPSGNPFVRTVSLPAATVGSGSTLIFGTLTFDADLQCWLMSGGNNDSLSAGLRNCVPVEVCFALCKELGMHPFWSIPGYALDPATDYVTSLAAYNLANNPGWMIPRYEPGNEIWNPGTFICGYAISKSFVHWQTDQNDEYGKWLSVMGQGVASVHGIGNLGVTYEVLCGVQADGGLYPWGVVPGTSPAANAGVAPRLTSFSYVNAGVAQSGYTATPAHNWTSAVLPSSYTSTAQRGKLAEWFNTWNYYVTNVGNSTAQMANLNDYVGSLAGNITASVTFTNGSAGIGWTATPVSNNAALQFSGASLPAPFVANKLYYVVSVSTNSIQVSDIPNGAVVTASANGSSAALFAPFGFTQDYEAQRWIGFKTFGAFYGVNKLMAYEGGYSPDLLGGTFNFRGGFDTCLQSNPETTPPTRATQCVVTINNVSGADNPDRGSSQALGGNPQVGNPCLPGMLVAFDGSGMPELENKNSRLALSIAGPDQTWTAHNLHPNEVVQFSNFDATALTNITAGQRYYVLPTNLTTNTFQFAAARGGSAITPSAAVSADVISAFVVVSVSGTQTTIDVDSSGFAAPTGSMTATYPNSITMINNFRTDALLKATDLNALTISGYNKFTAAGGSFPSQYQLSGQHSVWFVIQPDIWGTQSEEFAAIAAFNAH